MGFKAIFSGSKPFWPFFSSKANFKAFKAV